MELEVSTLSDKIDTDKEVFKKFAFNFIGKMGDNFLTISPEDRKKCKQIIFPADFYVDSEKKCLHPRNKYASQIRSKEKRHRSVSKVSFGAGTGTLTPDR